MKWPAAKTWNLALLCSHPFYPRSDPGPPSGRPPLGLAQAQAHCSIQRVAARGEGKEGTHRRTGARSWFIALLRCCALAILSLPQGLSSALLAARFHVHETQAPTGRGPPPL